MNAAVSIWDGLTRLVVFLLFIAGVLGVALWYFPLIKQNENYRKEILRLEAQINKQEETGKQLRAQIESLKRDPKAMERLARERLGYAKPGETVVRFEERSTNSRL